MSLIEKRDILIKQWLKEAAADIHEALDKDLEVKTKSRRNDLVTIMDRKIEQQLVKKIRNYFPDDQIVSEEGYGDNSEDINLEDNTVWFLDPIDGTLNFVLQKENFAVMVAVYEKNIGQQAYIYDVMKDKLYWAIKGEGVYCNNQLLPKMQNLTLSDGLFASNSMFLSEKQVKINTEITKHAMGVRTIGSAGIETTELVKGSTVAYVSYGLKPWDLAPGLMMIQENGGKVTRFNGDEINLMESKPSIMGTPAAIEKVKEIIAFI